jgi:histidinol dehydrogenase
MSNLNIQKLNTTSPDFNQQLQALLAWNETDDLDVHQRVLAIIADVRKRGDAAVIDYTKHFDKREAVNASELEMFKQALKAAWGNPELSGLFNPLRTFEFRCNS